jgi:predicted MFS family arabinose efflux permease
VSPDASVRMLGEGITGSDARRSSTFWLIATAFSLAGGAAQAGVIHLVPMLTDRGRTAEKAALASSALGIAYVLGRLVAGYLVDRFFASYVVAALFAGMALGLGSLWLGSSSSAAFLGASLVGLGMGGEGDLMPFSRTRRCARTVRFSAARYSFCCSSSWLANPVTYASRRAH